MIPSCMEALLKEKGCNQPLFLADVEVMRWEGCDRARSNVLQVR